MGMALLLGVINAKAAVTKFRGLSHAAESARVVADGINGVCMARLLRRADRRAAIAARVLTGAIAALSLGVAASSIWRLLNKAALAELGTIPGVALLAATVITLLLYRNATPSRSDTSTRMLV